MPDREDFLDFLSDLDDGELLPRLTQERQQVVRAVRRTGLVGEITLKLAFKPDGRTIITVPRVTTKVPTAKSNSTVFFDDEAGNLSRTDPKQLPLRHVTAARPKTVLRMAGQPEEEGAAPLRP